MVFRKTEIKILAQLSYKGTVTVLVGAVDISSSKWGMVHFQVHSLAVDRFLSLIVWWTEGLNSLLYGSLQRYMFSHQREQVRRQSARVPVKKYWQERNHGLF